MYLTHAATFSARKSHERVPRVALRRPFPRSLSPLPLSPVHPRSLPHRWIQPTTHPPTKPGRQSLITQRVRAYSSGWHRDGDPDFPSPSPCFSHRCTRAFLNLLGPPSLYLVPIKLHPQRTLIAIIINYYYDNNNRIFIIYYFINFISGKFNSLIIGISILF